MKRTAHLIAALAILASGTAFTHADQLLVTGGFEIPRVQKRTGKADGGNPLRDRRKDEWRFLTDTRGGEGGEAIVGVTNEIARTGKQALFIEFKNFTRTGKDQGINLEGELIPIQPGKPYRLSLWGRTDRKNPLTIDQRVPYMKVFVEWWMADKETQSEMGSDEIRLQSLPGGKNFEPLFNSKNWNEWFLEATSPADAAFVRINFRFETPPDQGTTNGTIFFDDLTLEGPPGPEQPDPLDEAEMEEKAAAEAEAAASKPAPAPPETAPPAAPADKK